MHEEWGVEDLASASVQNGVEGIKQQQPWTIIAILGVPLCSVHTFLAARVSNWDQCTTCVDGIAFTFVEVGQECILLEQAASSRKSLCVFARHQMRNTFKHLVCSLQNQHRNEEGQHTALPLQSLY